MGPFGVDDKSVTVGTWAQLEVSVPKTIPVGIDHSNLARPGRRLEAAREEDIDRLVRIDLSKGYGSTAALEGGVFFRGRARCLCSVGPRARTCSGGCSAAGAQKNTAYECDVMLHPVLSIKSGTT